MGLGVGTTGRWIWIENGKILKWKMEKIWILLVVVLLDYNGSLVYE